MTFSPLRAAFGAALLLVAPLPAAAAAVPPSLEFTVLRDGDEVGRHTLRFRERGDGLGVTIDTKVVVKVALIPIYRFEHHGEEVWRNGHLIALSSKTNDDGDHHVLTVSDDAGTLEVNGDDVLSRLPDSTLPASLWNPATVTQARLLNTLDGHAMAVTVSDLGEDTVLVRGETQAAHHFAVTGGLSRELWYDANGTLVQIRFQAKDDSEIRYVLN